MFENVRNCRVRIIKLLWLFEVSSYDFNEEKMFYRETIHYMSWVLPNFLMSQAESEENMKNCSPGLVCSTK